MLKSYLYHIQVNVNFKNIHFYKDLMSFMGWNIVFEKEHIVGFKSDTNGDLWFVHPERDSVADYDGIGVNHISFRVGEIKDIDELKPFLQRHNIGTLFGTPKHRPEFVDSKDETYYQIMFESPDKILFEIVYIGSDKN